MKLSPIEVEILENELKLAYPALAAGKAIVPGDSNSYKCLLRSRGESGMSRWEYNATLILFYLAAHDYAEE
jgi:hypothetical protein